MTSTNPQKEKELEYHDEDHAHAHGLTEALHRHRTLSMMTQTVEQKEWTHRRRGSHDEKVLGKGQKFLIDVQETKTQLLAQEDTDGDFQITVHDGGPKTFPLGTVNSAGYKKYEIRGHYMIANLLQELALAEQYGRKFIVLNEERLNENPVERMSRLIKYHFWDALTRRIDADGLEIICADPKNRSEDQRYRIYIPFHDSFAYDYFKEVARTRPHLNLEVVQLPELITPKYVKSINEHPGILSLGLRKVLQNGAMTVRGCPFVVPGGRFNEMYGWDSYFEALGLLMDGRFELARAMVDNFCYEIEHYGKILNANRSYYLSRSQPPFLTDMVKQVYAHLKQKDAGLMPLSDWLSQGIRACIKELFSVWLCSPRLDPTGLVKYHPEGLGIPTETESDHFLHILQPFADKYNLTVDEFIQKYNHDDILEPELDDYFLHDRAVRESGHDTTYRFEKKCAYLGTVDLNCLIYKYEKDLREWIHEEYHDCFIVRVRRGPNDVFFQSFLQWCASLEAGCFPISSSDSTFNSSSSPTNASPSDNLHKNTSQNTDTSNTYSQYWAKGILIFDDVVQHISHSSHWTCVKDWLDYDTPENADYFCIAFHAPFFQYLQDTQYALIQKYLWNEDEQMYFDYDCHAHEQSVYQSVTCLWTLWAGCCPLEKAESLLKRALSLFEVTGGLVSGTEESRGIITLDRPNRQWDWPYGWAPHQILAWQGLADYGFTRHAARLAYRWLFMIVKSFVDFNGVVPEKFDAVSLSHKVLVEYGNVGSDFKMVVKEGFGWMNASFVLGLRYLTPKMKKTLGALVHPDVYFSKVDRSG